MGTRIWNMFESFQLTDAELAKAISLAEEQRQYLQTRLSELAVQKLNMTFKPSEPVEYAQEEAYLRGRMDMLLELLVDQETTLPGLLEQMKQNNDGRTGV